jgi:hypothetical protein
MPFSRLPPLTPILSRLHSPAWRSIFDIKRKGAAHFFFLLRVEAARNWCSISSMGALRCPNAARLMSMASVARYYSLQRSAFGCLGVSLVVLQTLKAGTGVDVGRCETYGRHLTTQRYAWELPTAVSAICIVGIQQAFSMPRILSPGAITSVGSKVRLRAQQRTIKVT